MNEIFNCVLKMSVDASYMIVAVILARFLLRKSSKIFGRILWLLVGLRLMVPVSLESVLSLVPQKGIIDSGEVAVTLDLNTAVVVGTANSGLGLSDVVPIVWAVVAGVFAVFGMISFIKLKIKISDAVLLKDRVYQSEKIESPFVCGFLNPKIYIPYKMDEDTLAYVLKHENTHIKCFDHILKFMGFAILCVHWFNPLVWVSYILFCKDTELLCDEFVVRDMTDEHRKKYALALCNVGVEKVKISACPVAFGEVGIKERIKHAVNYRKMKLFAVSLSVVACVAVAVCFMTTPVEAVAEKDVKGPVQIKEFTKPIEITTMVEEVAETTESVTQPITESATQVVIEQYETPSDGDYYYDEESVTVITSGMPDTEAVTELETEPATEKQTEVEFQNPMFNLAASAVQENVYDWSNQEQYSFDMELAEGDNNIPSDDIVLDSVVADFHDIG